MDLSHCLVKVPSWSMSCHCSKDAFLRILRKLCLLTWKHIITQRQLHLL
ncbi:hypothetical protein Patl1_06822 [Pistacia atlantica]|uniref:Uncharacterized protein n=1 Tax=Pistacia atlantica TaxID=434234 RepID=A0ACC1AFQ7_9ROSI|nr:hypothetical protein Patl1_06822 [Pistacia atlantica]